MVTKPQINADERRFMADAAMGGLERVGTAFSANGEYDIIGWQGEKYVALNGKADKLSKLIVEQGTTASNKKTLTLGETWDVGDGWALTVNSIDAKATPKQVWLTLSKDGVKKDDKVIASGTGGKPIFTYVEKLIAGETDVPLFVTYVDSISTGAANAIVQLRYTWAVSTSVTHIKSSDTYGVFKNANISGKTISLQNSDTEIILSQNAMVDLMGYLKFKVADRADVLRFFPLILMSRDHEGSP